MKRLGFGEGAIREDEWPPLREAALAASRVLEIGAGLSTVLLDATGGQLVSLETRREWVERIGRIVSHRCTMIHYLCYPEFPDLDDFDFALVDGPADSTDHRLAAMRFAAERAPLVFVHDAVRDAGSVAQVFAGWQPAGTWSSLRAFRRPV